MAIANTLSVLLSFRTDLPSLQRAQAFLQGPAKRAQELNAKLQNGTAALNNALQAGAALLTLGALRTYSRDAIEARQAQAKLNQALTQAGQNTADYRAELAAQASAFERLTGLQDETVSGVQRQLIFFGVQRDQIEDLTRLTLDFAAAKEIDAVSAAKAVGRALIGEGDELLRYGVKVDLTRGKIEGLRDGLAKFAGQSGQAFGALPAGLREVTVSSRDAQESFGDLVLEISSPFLQGLARGLDRANASLREMRAEGSLLQSVLAGLTTTAGNFVGSFLGGVTLVTIAGGLLALKGASLLASQALALLASGFTFVSGRNLAQMLAGFDSAIKRLGVMKALAQSGWPRLLALGLAGVGAALGGFALGSVLINSIEAAQLARLDREQQIRQEIAGQTRALQQQAGAARTRGEVSDVRAEARRRVETDRARLEQLSIKEASDLAELRRATTGRTERAPRITLTEGESAELRELRLQLPIRERSLAFIESAAFAERALTKAAQDRLAAEQAAQKLADAALAEKLPELRSTRDAQNLAALDPAARAAELSRRREALSGQLAVVPVVPDTEAKRLDLENRISELNLKIAEALEQQAAKVREINDAGKERSEQLEKEQQQQRELAALASEQAFSRALGDLGIRRAEIESDRLLTANEKQRALLPLLEKENALIAARIALLLQEQQTANPADRLQLQQQIDQLRTDQAANAGAREDNRQLGIGEQVNADLTEFETSLGTRAQELANLFTSPLKAGIGALRNGMQALLGDTDFWSQKLGRIAGPIMGALTGAVSDLFQQWIASRARAALASIAWSAKEGLAAKVAALPGAILKSISTFGVAALVGVAAVTAALALGGFARGGPVTGPGSGTSDSIPVRLSNGEFVATASAVDRFGPDFFSGLNAGVLDLAALPGSVAAQLPRAVSAARSSSPAPRSAPPAPDMQALAERITIIQVSSRQEATRIARHSAARGDIVRIVEEDFGLPRKT